jgi:hypothetical protein
VIAVQYDKELERVLRARRGEFETRTRAAGHDWHEVDVTTAFAAWLGAAEYRDAYFESPEDLQIRLAAEFPEHVAERVRAVLSRPEVTENSVVAVLGLGSLLGFAHVSDMLKKVEPDIRGRLLLFFPGSIENNRFSLLDSHDGWNYMAVVVSLAGARSGT